MKKSLQNKLKGYIALTGSIAATGAGAQVVYTDINPDTVLHDSIFYNLDFNNDAVVDFHFRVFTDTANAAVACSVLPQGAATNAIEASVNGQYAYPFALNNGDTIKASNPNWVSYAQHSAMYLASIIGASSYGNFLGQNDKYMAARFDISGATHYGWVRLSINAAADTMIIKDYAYETQDSTDIIINQNIAGVPSHNVATGIRVHSYENTVFVHTNNPETGGKITVYNMSGQVVREEEITAGEMTINLEGQSTGMYIVHVLQGNAETTRKVFMR